MDADGGGHGIFLNKSWGGVNVERGVVIPPPLVLFSREFHPGRELRY